MKDSLTVSFQSFEEIEKRQNEMKENFIKTKEAFGLKKYLNGELTWNRSDNSYYNAEGQKMNIDPGTIYLGKGFI